MNQIPLLNTINNPADLRQLPKHSLHQLSKELRLCFLDNIAQTGGHFASNLGVIELSIALHYVFNTPIDHLIWDVGHQAYPHKILTGRRQFMKSMRQKDGLAPFPKITESEYDSFGTGHSSTSISAALGMAVADKLSGKNNHAIAVIGDGAMTAGEAFEALNNAGDMSDINLLVILNDNEMSISPNVGALPRYLTQNIMHEVKDFALTFKEASEKVLSLLPGALDAAKEVKSTIKEIVNHNDVSISLFNNFGFDYTGPVDGHDVYKLVEVLSILKNQKGPQLLHVSTKKGQGFSPAEKDPTGFHAIASFDRSNPPEKIPEPPKQMTYTQVFSDWLMDMAKEDPDLIAITPAMKEGSGLVEFAKNHPQRYFDVGIAEQHAVTFAAGLACGGKKPIVAIYSTFLQRAYDQVIHDVAIQNLNVMFAIDRAGIVGADGPTHVGAYDLSFMRSIPNLVIACPSDEEECRLLLSTCFKHQGPTAIRYPRGRGRGAHLSTHLNTLPVGKGIVRHQGQKLALMAFGSMVAPALKVGQKLGHTVIDMRFVKPLDKDLLRDIASTHDAFVTLEENTIMGGAGSAVSEALAEQHIVKPIMHLGIPDIVTAHGDPKLILAEIGLDEESITQKIMDFINRI